MVSLVRFPVPTGDCITYFITGDVFDTVWSLRAHKK